MRTAATQHRLRFLESCLLLVFLAWPLRAFAQSSPTPAPGEPPLNLSQLLENLFQKNAERAEALQKYQGTRLYNLDYKGFPASVHAEMTVEVIYNAPATKGFKIISQSGPQWIIDKVLKRLLDAETESMSEENRARLALTPSNYNFSALEYQDAADNCSYSVAVEPRIPSKLLYRGRIWVDSRDFAVCRIEAEPSKNPSFWIKKTAIHHSYLKIGDFWLPAKNESVSAVRGGGRAVLTIRYQSYEIQAARPLKSSDAAQPSTSFSLPGHAN